MDAVVDGSVGGLNIVKVEVVDVVVLVEVVLVVLVERKRKVEKVRKVRKKDMVRTIDASKKFMRKQIRNGMKSMIVIKIVNEDDISIFGRFFPIAKTNKNERINGNVIGPAIPSLELIANMRNKALIVVVENLTHAIAEHLGNNNQLLEFILRKT